jgi:hypothetical protein
MGVAMRNVYVLVHGAGWIRWLSWEEFQGREDRYRLVVWAVARSRSVVEYLQGERSSGDAPEPERWRVYAEVEACDLEREDGVWSIRERRRFVELWRELTPRQRDTTLARLRQLGAESLGGGGINETR